MLMEASLDSFHVSGKQILIIDGKAWCKLHMNIARFLSGILQTYNVRDARSGRGKLSICLLLG
jgi:hypothetical protein